MILDIDVGNSRIKWRTSLDAGVRASVCGSGVVSQSEVDRWLQGIGREFELQQIRMSSVAYPQIVEKVKQQAELWGCQFVEAAVCDEMAGVKCGYSDPSALGVDRWLACIAAYHQFGGPCVVLDMGTAITLDLVSETGQHQGGYIVPGLQMMRQSLFQGTNRVKVEDHSALELLPGRTTEQAVSHGNLIMVKSMVEAVIESFECSSSDVHLIITGGDAETLLAVIDRPANHVPDLVLDGLRFF